MALSYTKFGRHAHTFLAITLREIIIEPHPAIEKHSRFDHYILVSCLCLCVSWFVSYCYGNNKKKKEDDYLVFFHWVISQLMKMLGPKVTLCLG